MDKEIKRDYLGNEVSVGDEVVFLQLRSLMRGKIIKLMPNSVLIQYNHSTESTRFYDQIIKI